MKWCDINRDLDFCGYSYSDIGGKMPPFRYALKVHVNQLETRDEVLNWYLAMNEGGAAHTEDELQRVRDLRTKDYDDDVEGNKQ